MRHHDPTSVGLSESIRHRTALFLAARFESRAAAFGRVADGTGHRFAGRPVFCGRHDDAGSTRVERLADQNRSGFGTRTIGTVSRIESAWRICILVRSSIEECSWSTSIQSKPSRITIEQPAEDEACDRPAVREKQVGRHHGRRLRRPGGGREVRAVAAAYRLPLPIRFPMGSPPRNVLRLDPRS